MSKDPGSPNSPALDQLYEYASLIQQHSSSASSNPECETAFVNFIESCRSKSDNERKLASQLIIRFHRQFGSHVREAFEAVSSLVRDDNVNIRRQALHDLPLMATNDILDHAMDALLQEFGSDDEVEAKLVQKAVISLMSVNQEAVLRRLFREIPNYTKPILHFLKTRVVEATIEEVPANQTLVLPLIRDSIHRVPSRDDETFFDLFELMGRYPIMQTLLGRKELVDILSRHAGLPFEHDGNVGMVRKVLKCLVRGLRLFSKNVHSNKFADFMFEHACPKVLAEAQKSKKIADDKADDEATNNLSREESIEIMRDIVDMTATYHNAHEHLNRQRQQMLFDLLNAFLVEPCLDDDSANQADPDFDLSMLEAALLAFHWSCRERIEFVRDELDRDEFKSFKIRLQYLAQASRHYLRQMERKSESARANLANIQNGVKDFFHSPLTEIRSNLWPSWRKPTDRVVTPPPRQEWEMSRKRRPNSRAPRFYTYEPKMARYDQRNRHRRDNRRW